MPLGNGALLVLIHVFTMSPGSPNTCEITTSAMPKNRTHFNKSSAHSTSKVWKTYEAEGKQRAVTAQQPATILKCQIDQPCIIYPNTDQFHQEVTVYLGAKLTNHHAKKKACMGPRNLYPLSIQLISLGTIGMNNVKIQEPELPVRKLSLSLSADVKLIKGKSCAIQHKPHRFLFNFIL